MHLSSHRPGIHYVGIALSLCLMGAGCSSLSASKIHQSAKGSVHLHEVADWSFEASHPVIIDHMTMLKVVKGVVADSSTLVSTSKMPASGSKPMRVFSDEDAEFLAPLLAQGLSQAKPEQIVGFTVSSSAGSGLEPTVGTLYAQGGAIYLTTNAPNGKKPTAFAPSGVGRLEKAPSFAAARAPGAMAIVIDYQALAKIAAPASELIATAPKAISNALVTKAGESPAPARSIPVRLATPADTASGAAQMSTDEILSRKLDELRLVREASAQKDSEIKVLRREAEWMKQELRERSAELRALRASKISSQPASKKKTAEARPFP